MTDAESPEAHDKPYDLRPGAMDYLATVVRAAGALGSIGQVPGATVGELIASTLPGQRVDRIARYVEMLDVRVSSLEEAVQARIRKRIGRTPYLDLFGEGLESAAEALSEERLSYIAELVNGGLASSDSEALQRLFLIRVLEQLNDAEIIILRSLERFGTPEDEREFYSKNRAVFDAQNAVMGSPQEDIDASGVYDAYRQHLESLGLVQYTYEIGRRGEIPELDPKTGRARRRSPHPSILGRMLLREIGIPGEGGENASTEDARENEQRNS